MGTGVINMACMFIPMERGIYAVVATRTSSGFLDHGV